MTRVETSLTLLEKARLNDQKAWHTLVEMYSPIVYGWCRRRFHLQPNDAQDIGAQVFVAVAVNLTAFERRRDGSFHRWLWVITKRKVLDFAEKRKKEPQSQGGSDWHRVVLGIEDHNSATDDEVDSETVDELFRSVANLVKSEFSDLHWQAFWCFKAEEKTVDEVASELGTTKAVVYNATSRITRRIRELSDGLVDSNNH